MASVSSVLEKPLPYSMCRFVLLERFFPKGNAMRYLLIVMALTCGLTVQAFNDDDVRMIKSMKSVYAVI
jgi:hypothetical protein